MANQIKINNISEDLLEIIKQKLTLPNPKWEENNKLGRWNGRTEQLLKFYDIKQNGSVLIPRGYARQFLLLCKNFKIPYELIDKRRLCEEVPFRFCGTLKSFQQKAVNAMLVKDFGALCAPTGSGKTIMALYMIAMRRQPALIIVHTKELAFQWISQINKFLKIPKNEIGLIGGGKLVFDKTITVGLVQSIYKHASMISSKIGYLIVDECHRTPSRTFTEAVSAFDTKYLLGLSATLFRRDRLSDLIFWYLGDMHYKVEKSSLIEKGEILSGEIIFKETSFKPFFDPAVYYSKMMSELTADDERNQLIVSDIVEEFSSTKGIILVLSDRKKHCETIQSFLKYKHNISSEILTGDLSAVLRQKIIKELNCGRVKILIATGQLIGEGFDCKEFSTLFLVTPIRFSGRLMQYVGRVLRPSQGKKKAKIFDYIDVCVGVLNSAASHRKKIYEANYFTNSKK